MLAKWFEILSQLGEKKPLQMQYSVNKLIMHLNKLPRYF